MLWRVVCKLVGHLENSETIGEFVYSPSELKTVYVEYPLLTCDRCGRVLS